MDKNIFHGKSKAVTFSFDDATTQDLRLVELLNKYGVKATFNLSSELFETEECISVGERKIDQTRISRKTAKEIYRGHEIASHTLTHTHLPTIADEREITRQVEEDRRNLTELAGYEVRGFAYPCSGENNNDRVADIIKRTTGIRYCRTPFASYRFDLEDNPFRFHPTVHLSEYDELFRLGEQFLKLDSDKPVLFSVWGHSYELDIDLSWERFEEFLKMISGKSDIYYGTCIEVLDAAKAYHHGKK
jgi:peptidoglycan/xylan/chitin deacetylase (PgdA/CDA1 family)